MGMAGGVRRWPSIVTSNLRGWHIDPNPKPIAVEPSLSMSVSSLYQYGYVFETSLYNGSTNGVAGRLLLRRHSLPEHVVSFHCDVDPPQLSQPTRAIPRGIQEFRDPGSALPKRRNHPCYLSGFDSRGNTNPQSWSALLPYRLPPTVEVQDDPEPKAFETPDRLT